MKISPLTFIEYSRPAGMTTASPFEIVIVSPLDAKRTLPSVTMAMAIESSLISYSPVPAESRQKSGEGDE